MSVTGERTAVLNVFAGFAALPDDPAAGRYRIEMHGPYGEAWRLAQDAKAAEARPAIAEESSPPAAPDSDVASHHEVMALIEGLSADPEREWSVAEIMTIGEGVIAVSGVLRRAQQVGEGLDAAAMCIERNDRYAESQLEMHRCLMVGSSERGRGMLQSALDAERARYAPVELLSDEERKESKFLNDYWDGVPSVDQESRHVRNLIDLATRPVRRSLRENLDAEGAKFRERLEGKS